MLTHPPENYLAALLLLQKSQKAQTMKESIPISVNYVTIHFCDHYLT